MEANKNDELSEIIKSSWKLSDNPEISNISCILIESKQQKKNSGETLTSNGVEMMQQHISAVESPRSVSSANTDDNDNTVL